MEQPAPTTGGYPVTIVLDTNVFFSDAYAQKSWLKAVLDGAGHGDFEVVVPETVVRELIKQFPTRLDSAVEDANKAIGRMARDLGRLSISAPSRIEVDRDRLVTDYEGTIRTRLSSRGCRVEPDPTDLTPAIDWSVRRRAPFKESGEGLPDAAIWLTVLDLAAAAGQVLLVSTNASDFGDGADPAGLADDLRSDLQVRGLPEDRVRLVTSIGTLVDEVVKPLAEAEARAARLIADPVTRDRLTETFINSLAYSPIPQDELRLGVDLDNDPQPISLGFEKLELQSAREVGDGTLLMELRALSSLHLDLMVFKADAYLIDERSPVSIAEPDWNDHYAEAEAEIEAWLDLQVATDLDVTDVEVEVTAARRLSDDEIVELRLERGDGQQLLDELRDPSEPRELPIDSYLPDLPLDSDIEEAAGESLDPTSVELVSVDDVLEDAFVCTLKVHAEGDVRWLVTAPSSYDSDRYASLSELEAGEGGWLSDVEANAPLTLLVTAELAWGGEWRRLRIEEIVLEESELRRRSELPSADLEALIGDLEEAGSEDDDAPAEEEPS